MRLILLMKTVYANHIVIINLICFSLMKISPTSLKVSSRGLVNFHNALTSFLPKLDRVKPIGHPSSEDHLPIRPGLMLNFALKPEYREKLNNGLTQLVQLRAVLQSCKERAVQTNSSNTKSKQT